MLAGIAGSVALGGLAASGSPLFDPLAVNLWLTLAFGASCYLFRGVLPRLRDYPDAIELNVVFVVALSVVGLVLADLVMQLGFRPRGGLTVPAVRGVRGGGRHGLGAGAAFRRGAPRGARARDDPRAARAREDRRGRGELREHPRTERARVLSEERERILRDMDEGLGSQLVSTLALTERPETRIGGASAIAVRAALDDLRLVVDSLDPFDGELRAGARDAAEPHAAAARRGRQSRSSGGSPTCRRSPI